MNPELDVELDDKIIHYLNNAETWRPGGFLTALAEAYFRADGHNRRILQPAMLAIMDKYPEYEDRNPHYNHY